MTKTEFIERLYYPLILCFMAVSVVIAILFFPPLYAVTPFWVRAIITILAYILFGRLFLFHAKKKLDLVKLTK